MSPLDSHLLQSSSVITSLVAHVLHAIACTSNSATEISGSFNKGAKVSSLGHFLPELASPEQDDAQHLVISQLLIRFLDMIIVDMKKKLRALEHTCEHMSRGSWQSQQRKHLTF